MLKQVEVVLDEATTQVGLRDMVAAEPAVRESMDELADLAGRMISLGYRIGADSLDQDSPSGREAKALRVALMAVKRRSRRDKLLGKRLFTDPIWNILLDLYVAGSQHRFISISSACIAAGVPLSSAIRCCKLLEERGLAFRERDPSDGRRIFLRLSSDCHRKMTLILSDSEDTL